MGQHLAFRGGLLADALFERGPARLAVLPGDGELRVVQGGKFTRGQAGVSPRASGTGDSAVRAADALTRWILRHRFLLEWGSRRRGLMSWAWQPFLMPAGPLGPGRKD
jgi:hypothetical protein